MAQSARVSMATVAAAAGVSAQTVSRVVNDSPRVDPVTRERVEQAMAELGYRPHRAARALRTGRSHTLGVVAETLATVGNSRMLQAVAEAAALRGYGLSVVTLAPGERIGETFERLADQGIDGAIVLNEAAALARDAAPAGLHLVVTDSPPSERYSVVAIDHAAGAGTAVAHLLAAGHRTVHHLAGPEGSYAAAERTQGWRDALIAAGADIPPVVRGDWSAHSGFTAATALFSESAHASQGIRPTALFVANDQMALGALRALALLGLRVPEDVAVIGFDDVVDAGEFRPPLTTVRQDFSALGARAVRTLVSRIEGAGSTVPDCLLLPTLVVRESA